MFVWGLQTISLARYLTYPRVIAWLLALKCALEPRLLTEILLFCATLMKCDTRCFMEQTIQSQSHWKIWQVDGKWSAHVYCSREHARSSLARDCPVDPWSMEWFGQGHYCKLFQELRIGTCCRRFWRWADTLLKAKSTLPFWPGTTEGSSTATSANTGEWPISRHHAIGCRRCSSYDNIAWGQQYRNWSWLRIQMLRRDTIS